MDVKYAWIRLPARNAIQLDLHYKIINVILLKII